MPNLYSPAGIREVDDGCLKGSRSWKCSKGMLVPRWQRQDFPYSWYLEMACRWEKSGSTAGPTDPISACLCRGRSCKGLIYKQQAISGSGWEAQDSSGVSWLGMAGSEAETGKGVFIRSEGCSQRTDALHVSMYPTFSWDDLEDHSLKDTGCLFLLSASSFSSHVKC